MIHGAYKVIFIWEITVHDHNYYLRSAPLPVRMAVQYGYRGKLFGTVWNSFDPTYALQN